MATSARALRTAAALLAVAGFAALLWRVAAAPSGPVEPAWDKVACARCHMLVSDPGFAAQLHTASGEVRFYDDPGCLLLARAEAPAAEPRGEVWFHDSSGESWLAEREARFVPATPTPMGHGLAALPASAAPEGLDTAGALAQLRAHAEAAP